MQRPRRLRPLQVEALHELAFLRAKLELAAVTRTTPALDFTALVTHLEPAEASEIGLDGFNGMHARFVSHRDAIEAIERHQDEAKRDLRSLIAHVSHGTRHGALLVDLLPGHERLRLLDHALLDSLNGTPNPLARDVIHITRLCLHRNGALALLDQTCEENADIEPRCLERVRSIVAQRWTSPVALLTAIRKAQRLRPPHPVEAFTLDLLTRAIRERQLMDRAGIRIEAPDDDPIAVH